MQDDLILDAFARGYVICSVTGSVHNRHGRAIGRVNKDGYVQVFYKGTQLSAHRMVWVWCHGPIPGKVVHHRNEVRNDNRIENLLATSQGGNMQAFWDAHGDPNRHAW